MKKKIILLFILISNSTFAQGNANIWYFGDNAGLDFNSGSPVVLTDGALSTVEGCSSISNSNGELLFYTDGRTIWNKNHIVMQNGGGLHGNASSTQSGIIVPKSENDSQYYVFTVDEQNSNAYGLKYSVVDMTSDGGLGEVLSNQKNIPLLAHCSEKIAAFKSGSCGSIWVIAFSSADGVSRDYDTFHSFEVTGAGINTTSVTSTFPTTTNGGIGYLKISTDGSKLGIVHSKLNENGVFLYDFDFSNGQVSNEVNLILSDPTHPNNKFNTRPYGIEFSRSLSKLYVTSIATGHTYNESPQDGFLWQFDLESNGYPAKLIDYRQGNLYRGALQMGPDGKIYRALSIHYDLGSHFLGVINNPEANGVLCDYQHDAIDLGTGVSRLGLPPFIQSLTLADEDIINDSAGYTTTLALCVGDTYHLGLQSTTSLPTSTTFSWYFNDNLILPIINTSYLDINDTNYGSGNYKLKVDINSGACVFYGEAEVTFHDFPILNSPITINQCDDDLDGISVVDLSTANENISTNYEDETFTYYTSETDAILGDNPINPTDAANFTTGSTGANPLWVRVEVATCFEVGEIHINIASTNTTYTGTIYKCDDYIDTDNDDTDGVSSFNLSEIETAVINQFPIEIQGDLNIDFYHSVNDAQLQQNTITNRTDYRNEIPNNERIYIRVNHNSSINCAGLGSDLYVDLVVEKLPIAHEIETIKNCDTGLNTSYFDTSTIESAVLQGQLNVSLSYFYTDNNVQIPIPSAEFYPTYLSEEKTITVRVSNNNTNDSNGSCYDETTVELLIVDPILPIIETVTIFDNLPNNRVSVLLSNVGDYEFSLDNEPFVNANELHGHIFNNVTEGLHTIHVNELNGCSAITSKEIIIIRFPKFITPNHDGINDTFSVYGGDAFMSSTLTIYDRYGKKIAHLKNNIPWDGTYLNKIANETEYWFVVTFTYSNGIKREQKGHFSLKY